MMDFRESMQKCQEYVHGLEEERRKIQVFKRELPLCFELVTQAIDACKRQLSGTSITTECSEQTTSNGPILEEFMPIIRSTHSDDDGNDDDDEHEYDKPQTDTINLNISTNDNINDNSGKKSDWLRSVQLWNQTLDTPTNQQEDQEPKRVAVVEVKNNNGGGAFHPFNKEKGNCDDVIGDMNENGNVKPASMPAASASSSAEAAAEDVTGSGSGSGNGNKKEEKNGQSEKKSRRCWSPELHRRFLHSLQQLGGSHVATPKQIRELMKVDGLTNDEVKSHLQKYRLHTRRPNSTTVNQNHTTPPTPQPQFVVVGGIWVPPQEFPSPQTNNIYTPVSTVASTVVTPRQQHKLSSHLRSGDRRSSPSDGLCGLSSNSHTTSSSTHTTTASHAF